jgi:ABC-type glutathione transport system ATPase component
MINWSQESRLISDLRVQRDALALAREREVDVGRQAVRRRDAAIAAQEVLQLLAQAVQQKAHERICHVVSSCLSAVFDDPYSFHIEFERKRGRTEAALRFRRRGLEVDPLTASGGGVVDVASFALRIACLVMHRPKLSRVLVLDEPFRFVSAQYQEGVRTMLEQISAEMKVQIIFITHNPELATGKILEL